MKSAEDVLDHGSPEPTVQNSIKVVIPYTTPDLTRAALKAVGELVGELRAEPVLMAIHTVPYPLPLGRPAVPREFLLQHLKNLASSSTVPLSILLIFARDRMSAFRKSIPPGSIVVIAARRRWWRTAEDRLARTLVKDGHRVLLFRLRQEKWILSSNAAAPLPIANPGTVDNRGEMSGAQVAPRS